MKQRTLWAAVAVVVALMIAYGAFASNMMFKLQVQLYGPGDNGSLTGTQIIALPFNQQVDLVDADTLSEDISPPFGANVASIARFVRSFDGLAAYVPSSGAGQNFSLVKGEAYFVTVIASQSYIIVGTHDPSFSVPLLGPQPNASGLGTSSGSNSYAYPYHSTAINAEDLINEINSFVGPNVVELVSRYVRSTNSMEFYTGFTGTNFVLVAGEGYVIKVNSDVSFVPSHY